MRRRLIVVDLETGGLESGRDEILEIGILLVDLLNKDGVWTYDVIGKFHSLVKPCNPERINPKVLELNRLNMKDLMVAPNHTDVKIDFKDWFMEMRKDDFEVIGNIYENPELIEEN